jgi:large subunit ribosomal protein L18e
MSSVNYSALPFSARGGAKASKSQNKNLLGLQTFFKKIVDTSAENCPILIRQIEKKLRTTRRCRPVVKISKIVEDLAKESSEKVPIVVAKVLDDERLFELPALKIVALQWSKTAQRKIEANGGSIHTLDQFIKIAGALDSAVLISGDINKRNSAKFWGPAPGEKHSTALPRGNRKMKNCEKRVNVKKTLVFEQDSE